jgi:4-amino-4-deoxy-L-arabinose transferase-like glycosyltransferase
MPTAKPVDSPPAQPLPTSRSRVPDALLAFAGLFWIFQVAWFWRYCGRNINADAVSYIGIARHIADGDFRASLHGYWSPLISWLIAALSPIGNNRTLIARLLMLPAFALCLYLMYRLTQRLWNSRLLSALVVVWFIAARGVAAFPVYFIGADLLLTAALLAYFILLLRCLEQPDTRRNWLLLGTAHAVAFLAKAIAMPLLALATLLAVISTRGKSLKKAAVTLIFAAIVPALIWASWGTALQQKYGRFTTGYQLRWNLIDPALKRAYSKTEDLAVLTDMRPTYDAYMVTDAMPPASRFWQVKVWRPSLLRQLAGRERQNIPEALKQIMVLLTPGGVLALILCVAQLTRGQRQGPARFRFLWIVLITTTTLLLAYCMLVFDSRYVLPIVPVLMALSIRFAVPASWTKQSTFLEREPVADVDGWQKAAGILLVLGLFAVQVYWASPFRTIRQDFQHSVYDAADILRKGGARNFVTVGQGPYPEHGVGWEAGVYAAYFAEARIIALSDEALPGLNPDLVVADVGKLAPDAVVIWGAPDSSSVATALRLRLQQAYPNASVSEVTDSRKGNVGAVVFLRPKA